MTTTLNLLVDFKINKVIAFVSFNSKQHIKLHFLVNEDNLVGDIVLCHLSKFVMHILTSVFHVIRILADNHSLIHFHTRVSSQEGRCAAALGGL